MLMALMKLPAQKPASAMTGKICSVKASPRKTAAKTQITLSMIFVVIPTGKRVN